MHCEFFGVLAENLAELAQLAKGRSWLGVFATPRSPQGLRRITALVTIYRKPALMNNYVSLESGLYT